jgi:hypothetical protein
VFGVAGAERTAPTVPPIPTSAQDGTANIGVERHDGLGPPSIDPAKVAVLLGMVLGCLAAWAFVVWTMYELLM